MIPAMIWVLGDLYRRLRKVVMIYCLRAAVSSDQFPQLVTGCEVFPVILVNISAPQQQPSDDNDVLASTAPSTFTHRR
jgi:hypothetical protein